MAGTDKLIGTLRLDLSQLEAGVNKANALLKSLGQGINLDLSDIAMQAIQQKLTALTKAAEEYGKKMGQASTQAQQSVSGVSSEIEKVTRQVTTLNTTTGSIKQVTDGFDSLGRKITEVSDGMSVLSRKTVDISPEKTGEQVKSLVALYNQLAQAQTKLVTSRNAGNNREASYWQTQIGLIEDEINSILKQNSALEMNSRVRRASAAAVDALNLALSRLVDADEREAQKEQQKNTLAKQTENTYKQLRAAVSDYQSAMKVGNKDGMAEAASRITMLEQEITDYERLASTLNQQSAEYKQLQTAIARMRTEYEKYQNLVNYGSPNAPTNDMKTLEQSFTGAFSRISSMMTSLLLYRGLRKLWTEAKEYAMEYYGVLKEIQVVTMASDSQMEAISENFQRMASALSVSATDIAKGAVIFYRQGLDSATTENYLEWATKFSKISNTELKDTSEYITAVLNSMQSLNGNAKRVVDVFTYMGDHAATSGAEIATAMQKAAATADNAGMEFEFLAAAIATVSATTRQAPETIGTAFNTMMARLHSIKQRGYNEEDETKINDVAKALNSVGIALMDSSGQWRDFDDILIDISQKWDTMTDKQQSYIATTMAGVRAQNYFIALMKDMSKGMEGGSTMWDLYQGAKQSTGIVDEKYTVWLTSAEAAQNKLTAAVQAFYTLLNTGDFFTAFYNGMAGFVSLMTSGTKAMQGWNLGAAAMALACAGIAVAIGKIIIAVNSGLNPMSMFFDKHPIIATVTAVAGLVTIITGVVGALYDWAQAQTKVTDSIDTFFSETEDKLNSTRDVINNIAAAQKVWTDRANEIGQLKARYEELTSNTHRTKEENVELQRVVTEIIAMCPELAGALQGPTSAMQTQKEVVDGLNASMETYNRLAREQGKVGARQTGFAEWRSTVGTFAPTEDLLRKRDNLAIQLGGDLLYLNTYANQRASGATETQARRVAGIDAIKSYAYHRTPDALYHPLETAQLMADEYGIDYNPWTTEDMIYGALYDALFVTLEQDKLQLQQQKEEALDQGRTMLRNFVSYDGLNDNVTRWLEEQENGILSGLTTDSDIIRASDDLEKASQRAQKLQYQLNTNAALNSAAQNVNSLWGEYERLSGGEGTSEEILQAARNYNASVDEFDRVLARETNFSPNEIKFFHRIEEGQENLANAKEIVEAAGSEMDQRRVLRQAQMLKYATQRNALDLVNFTNADGSINRKGLQTAVEEMERTTPKVWEAMLDVPGFKNFVKSVFNPSVADNVIREQWAESEAGFHAWDNRSVIDYNNWLASEAARIEYGPMTHKTGNAIEMTSGYGTINQANSLPNVLAWAYHGGGETGNVERLLDLYSSLDDRAGAFFDDHPDLKMEKFADKQTGEVDYAAWVAALEQFQESVEADNAETVQKGYDTIGENVEKASQKFVTDMKKKGETLTKEAEKETEAMAARNRLEEGTPEYFGELAASIGKSGQSASEAIESIDTLLNLLSSEEGLAMLRDADLLDKDWENLGKIGITKDNIKNLKTGSAELKNIKKNLESMKLKNIESMNQVLSGTAKAVDSLAAGTKEWIGYQKTLFQGVDTATKLQGAYNLVMDKSLEGTEEYTEAMNYLAQQTGLTAEQLGTEGGMAQALLYIQNQTGVVQESIASLAGSLLMMDGLTFDPSQIVNGYIALGEGADESAVQVANLVNTALAMLGASIDFIPDGNGGGRFAVNGIKGDFDVKPKETSKKKGGGGGGGGGNKEGFSDRLAVITAQMGRSVDKYKEMLERLSLYESMYSDQGELTNVLRVQEQRRQVLLDQQKAYEDILRDMPGLIEKAKQEMSNYKVDSDDYKKALSTLQGLEDSYASYTQELIKNRAEQLKNADAMRETQQAIIQLEANVRNTIQSVIMDRNNREKESLSARISMEEDVLEAIKKRYENERDEIIETTDLRIKSLNDETQALSDALDERKNLADDQKKWDQLTELQDQYARIIADPTRAKEAKDIAQKIADLQEEIGWTTAEREVEAQQKLIDEQLKGLEDYEEATNKFYETLLEDPRNFMEEYNNILGSTDAEIINWLMENSDNYLKATDAAREQLLQGWRDTLDELRMYTRTVWDEVEAILNLGDSGIMQFLMQNSQEYREANAYDQMNMVYEWTDMLRDWHAAYVDTFQDLEYMEFTNTMYDWVTYLVAQHKSSGRGGGGGGRGSGSGTATPAGYIEQVGKNAAADGYPMSDLAYVLSQAMSAVHFASGGLAYGSGLAFLDGTAGMPERVLSPEQTAAFERLVNAITSPSMVSVPGIRGGMIPAWSNGGAGAFFGDINISVESLDSDTDIDNLADKLMDSINERMTRGMVVGGVSMGY